MTLADHRRDAFTRGLGLTLETTRLSGMGERHEGKVRDSYVRPDGTRLIVVTDRISAFDRVLGTLPFKGQILNRLATYWLEASRGVCASHFVSMPDPTASLVRECAPLPLEVVMRGALTGVTSTSIWTHYERGARTFAGHRLRDGMKKNELLPEPLFTPSTKAPKGGHDETVSRAEVLARGLVSEAELDAVEALAKALFAFGQRVASERGLILADTKYELGRSPEGELVVIDEIHTPDSSRYWLASSYEERLARGEEPESFDKEYVRRWLSAQGFTGDGPVPAIPDEVRVEAALRYARAFDAITGSTFEPDLEPPLARLERTLAPLRLA